MNTVYGCRWSSTLLSGGTDCDASMEFDIVDWALYLGQVLMEFDKTGLGIQLVDGVRHCWLSKLEWSNQEKV